MKRLIFTCLFLTNFGALCSQNTDYSQLDTFIETLHKNNKMMGDLVISVDGKIEYQKSVGHYYSSKNEKKSLTKRSKYRIASITKCYTATMIFQLIDEGKLKLSDKLSNYFSEIPNANTIKIANLLNHSSGIFNITEEERFETWQYEPSTHKMMLQRMVKHPAVFQPGEKYSYSNSNFILLGYILEKIDKTTYAEALQNRIANKIGLKNTYYGDVINTDNNEVYSYHYNDDGSIYKAKEGHITNPAGAGGIVSTSNDLVKFYEALFSNKLISEKSFKIMTTINGDYGSGILGSTRNDQRIYGNNGRIDEFRSFAMYSPETKTAVALTTNALDYGMIPILFNAFSASEGKVIEQPNFETIDIKLTEEELKIYEGVYGNKDLPFDIHVVIEETTLKVGQNPKALIALNAIKEDEFSLERMGLNIKFNVNEKALIFTETGSQPIKFIKE